MADNYTNKDINDNTNTTTTGTADTEPATGHDVGIGGGLGAVGGAIVGALAGGPVGLVIGAIAGGVASAGAVDVVDKHDHDYDKTTHGTGTIAANDTTGTYGNTGVIGTDTTGTYGNTGVIGTTGTGYPDAAGRVDAPAAGYGTTGYAATDRTSTGDTMQLREEELTASKQQVAAGEVTLHKEVITETKSIDVPVSREELVIERHAVSGGQAVAGDFDTDDEVVRIPLMEEQVTLDKTAVVTGEVSVGKRTVTETEHLSGTVRREEARVETTDGAAVVDRDGGATR